MKRNINNKLLRTIKFFAYKNILKNSLLSVVFLHRRTPHFLCFSNNQKSTKIHHLWEFMDTIKRASILLINRLITGVFTLFGRILFYRVGKLPKTIEIGGKIKRLTRTQINQKVFSYLTALKGAVLPVRLPFGKRIGSTRTVPFRLLGFEAKL